MNGGMKCERRWPKRDDLLMNGFREEIGLPMTDTEHKEWLWNGQSKLAKAWRTGNGETYLGIILRVIKICFENK